MGKIKEIAQIPIIQHPHIRLDDILNIDEYCDFLNIFKCDKENTLLNEALYWEIGEYNSIKICDKVDFILLTMGFNPTDVVYLDI